MARMFLAALLLAGASVMQVEAVGAQAKMMANPIRKVVNMLQHMTKQVEEEGKAKEEAYEKFMCYCKSGGSGLQASIDAAEDKIPQLESSIKEGQGEKAQLAADVKQAASDKAEAEKALAKASAIREKEEEANSKEVTEKTTNSAAIGKAVQALEREPAAAGSFLQANAGVARRLQSLSVSMDMQSVDRDLLASFLMSGSSSRGVGEILGILKQMKEDMDKDVADLTASEEAAKKDFESLESAKAKEAVALTKAIETKTVRVGDLSVSLAELSNDLEDTKEALQTDKQMLATMGTECKTKKQEYEAYQKVAADERVALAETIKLLNSDDALELFKKALPSSAASFMQVQVTAKSMQRRALAMLKAARGHRGHHDTRLDFLEIALHGGKVGFDKILKMVDDLMLALKKEQMDDDAKKSYCQKEFNKYGDSKKATILDIGDLEKAIADGQESLKSGQKDTEALKAGIHELDKAVAEATETRKKDNAEYTNTMAMNTATKDLLTMAKNRLNKFFNPKQYKEAPKRALSEEDQITVNMGGTLAPTAAPGIGAASFVQVQAHHQQKGNAQGVIRMIDVLIGDVDKDSAEAEVEEKDAQSAYETFMSEAKKKRAQDAKYITDKDGAVAETEAEVEQNKLALKDKKVELAETKKFIMGLHQECDFLLKFYEARKSARAGELESLDKAKAVLNGADYSFLQIGRSNLRGSK